MSSYLLKYPFSFAVTILVLMSHHTLFAQTQSGVTKSVSISKYNVIVTPVAFLNISPDAEAGGMGDLGVATKPNNYSQYWNPAKLSFSQYDFGVSYSHVPWLFGLVNDMFLSYIAAYKKINSSIVVFSSARYFKLGRIQLTDKQGKSLVTSLPYEFSLDAGLSLRLNKQFSLGASLRYITSDIVDTRLDPNWKTANGFSFDLSGYYHSPAMRIKSSLFNGSIIHRAGFNITNIGTKMSYTGSSADASFLPANLRIGYGTELIYRFLHSISASFEISKLLVPTPPIIDSNGNIVKGTSTENVNTVSGILRSFNDAPDGISEELKEIGYALGFDYTYAKIVSIRSGVFFESEEKGFRQYANIGLGMKYDNIRMDFAYLIPFSSQRSPLTDVLKFSISFNLGNSRMRRR